MYSCHHATKCYFIGIFPPLMFFFLLCLRLFEPLEHVERIRQQQQVLGHRQLYGFRPTKIFVFGDSYVDTGNIPKSVLGSWKEPYGLTFPGKPAGRFSDGRVLTDYLARFVGIKSPIAYRWRKIALKNLKYGMNFAFGGTGVFDTLVANPNMTTQIDFFQQVIKEAVYSPADLKSSLALVSAAGNDYSTYVAVNGSAEGFQPFITKVVNQLTLNMKRIHGLGVRKILVPSLPPLGCLPQSTSKLSFQQCNETENSLSGFHNLLLQQAVAKLNNETQDSAFVILDLFGAFMTTFKNKGSSKTENPLKPCCVGIGKDSSCGSVDDNGVKLYTVCAKPEASFFWDGVHPSQEGWQSVYSALKPKLLQIYC
ncbi:GDSL esterase/lipase [Citrus sinensis]|nr:GDSL esterase/lipase [Citrus sinensis]